MYRLYMKRIIDFILSFIAFIILLPLLLCLTIIGTIQMK